MTPPAPRALAWLAAAALAGCASLQQPPGPDAAVTAPIPSAWSDPGSGSLSAPPAAAGPFWARFGDPVLPELVAQALAQGSDVAAAQARLRQARAARELAGAVLKPSVGADASARASAAEYAGRSQQWQAGLDASWELDFWGAGRAGERAAQASLQASALSLAQTRVVVAAEVASTLITLRGAQARQAIAERNLASQQQTLQIVQWRQEAGLATTLDVEQARSAVEQTRAQLPALRSGARQAMHALAVLCGQAPATLQERLQHTPETGMQPLAATDAALVLPAELLRQRPDVQAAEQQLRAAAARVDEADAARLPSLSIGGTIGLSALRLGALGPGAGVASLLGSVSLPVLDFGRLQAQVRQQEAARDEAAATYRASVLNALQEVEDTLSALAAGREQLQAQQAAATSARRAAELAGARYRSGLVDFQTVLQAERTLFAAEDGVASSRSSLATQQVRLYKALGGGEAALPMADGTPVVPTSTAVIAEATSR